MLKNYWAIHMGQGNRYADMAYKNNFVGVGWEEVAVDLTNFKDLGNREFRKKIGRSVEKAYPDKHINARGQIVGQLYRFGNLMKIGDIIFAPHTQEGKIYAGVIDSDYFYQAEVNAGCPFQHRRKVKWLKVINCSDISKELKNSLGGIMTTFSISPHGDEIEKLLAGDIEQVLSERSKEFVLETHLEDFLVHNWQSLTLGEKYDIIKEEGQTTGQPLGQQYVTPIGRMDILAKDKDKKEWLVIELKKGKSSDQVVGQVLRYIGWVEENLAESGEEVRGLIITKEKSDKLRYALKILKNVKLMVYKIRFDLQE